MVTLNTFNDSITEDSKLYETPILRVGLTENKESIEFKSSGKISVYNNEGIALLKNVTSPTKWKIKIEQSYNAKYSYNILLGKFLDRDAAHELSYSLIEKGLGAKIKTLCDKLSYKNKLINDNNQYWVIVDNFISEEEAISFAKEVLADFKFSIIREKIKEPGAILEIFDSEYEKLGEAENLIRIIPESLNVVSYIFDMAIDNGMQLKNDMYRAFRGVLEFRSNDAGKLSIISEIPLEKYIESVMALEMKSEFPEEALKAFAITIRSKIISGLRIRHYNDPFDLCANSHCQLYTGISKASENIRNAVRTTIGYVLSSENKIYKANYSLNCGGCTEDSSIIELESFNRLNTNVFDEADKEQQKLYGDLQGEQNVRKWINAFPDVFCNFSKENELIHMQKYFRWEINYSQKELEEIISAKVGKLIGTLYDIIPIKRSFSGRLTEIEIIASNKNLIIKGEKNIRELLSRHILNSSCFYIEKDLDEDGIPFSFILRGAGMGHGVGLCLAGAVMMAKKGYKVDKILKHYFKGTKIKKVY